MFESLRRMPLVASVALVAAACAVAAVAATPEEDAAIAVGQAWVRAVMAADVDAQVKLLPATMFATPADRDRDRRQRVAQGEVAQIKGRKYVKFDLAAPSQTMKVGTTTAIVIPYQAILTSADGGIQVNSSLIALGSDTGRQWSVLDGSGQSAKTLRTLIPGYSGGLNVPFAASKALKAE